MCVCVVRVLVYVCRVYLFALWAFFHACQPHRGAPLSGSASPVSLLCLHNPPALTQWPKTSDSEYVITHMRQMWTFHICFLEKRLPILGTVLGTSIFAAWLQDLILFDGIFIVWASRLTRSTFPLLGIGFQVRQLLMCLSSALLLWQLNFPQGWGTFLSL